MRIGVNVRVLLSSRMEGVCRYMHETLRRMVLAHPEDQFYFFFDRPYDKQFIYADNVTPIVIGPPTRHPFLWYLWFEYQIPKALKKYKCDVFYSGDTYMSLSTHITTVIVCHDIAYAHYPNHIPWLKRKYYQKYFPLFHKNSDQIITVSNATKQDIIKTYALDGSKITTAYNAVKEGITKVTSEERSATRKDFADGKPYFIYVGSIHPRKNVVHIIKAFDLFKQNSDSDYKLVLVGRLAWNTEAFNQSLANAKHKDDIIFMQELYNEQVNALIGSAEAMVYVSLFEGFGLPIVEAMAAEVPVITSNISSMPEVAGDAAILVDPDDIVEIAEAMTSIKNDKELREELILIGKKQVLKFDWNETAEITYDVIHTAVKNRGATKR